MTEVRLQLAAVEGQLEQIDRRLGEQRHAIDEGIAERGRMQESERVSRHDLNNRAQQITLALDERLRKVEAAIAGLEARGPQ
jgi:hypothetical protein